MDPPKSNPVTRNRKGSKLSVIRNTEPHAFVIPVKRIHEEHDVPSFLTSKAYSDIMTFLLQLNVSMFPCYIQDPVTKQKKIQTWELGSPGVSFSNTVVKLRGLLQELETFIDQVPLDTGPRRFGNAAFKTWYRLVEDRVQQLLVDHLPADVLSVDGTSDISAKDELISYLLGSFGSSQRLDYGSGHELSFLAFLGCIWKLGGFEASDSGEEERGIVLGVVEPYLHLIRRLIKTYTLEPAGSHGVWGLDDHSFIPYIFGSAQYGTPMAVSDQTPTEGSCPSAPDPASITKPQAVARERGQNLYFGAIGFIYDVKKGAFWEHSPMLYDISGIQSGWAKINKGMIKMYNAEVLSKFPVVQHFPFGSLFSWEHDPSAPPPPQSAHTANHPSNTASTDHPTLRNPLPEITQAPWSHTPTPAPRHSNAATAAPWAPQSSANTASNGLIPTRAPWSAKSASSEKTEHRR